MYRLRVELPLQRAVSTDVADAISGLGGTVVSVDLREVDGAAAIDEIVVELPDRIDGSALRTVLKDDASAALLSSRSCQRDEPLTQALRWARNTETHPSSGEADLSRQLAAACPLSAVWIGSNDEAHSLPAVQMTLARGAPIVHRSTNLPDSVSDDDRRSPGWLLAVPDCYADARSIALLARPLSLRFTAGEVARVELLMAS